MEGIIMLDWSIKKHLLVMFGLAWFKRIAIAILVSVIFGAAAGMAAGSGMISHQTAMVVSQLFGSCLSLWATFSAFLSVMGKSRKGITIQIRAGGLYICPLRESEKRPEGSSVYQ
jgi:ABC-type uncharacterized transport system permease subunit